MNQFARPGLAVTELPSFNEDDKGKVLKINESSGELGWEQQDDPLPPVSSSDNGKVLAVEDGAWAAQQKKFIVTLTPTELDYSGTMDKTVAEINAAYEAGMDVWFSISVGGASFMFPLSTVVQTSNDYPSFQWAFLFVDNNFLVQFYTASTTIGTDNQYFTSVYTLTPAS